MPRLANQREDYLLKAMREYKSGSRTGYAGAMATELQRLSDDDCKTWRTSSPTFPARRGEPSLILRPISSTVSSTCKISFTSRPRAR